MSKLITHINDAALKEYGSCNCLTDIRITPTCWHFEIGPVVVNGQQTTDSWHYFLNFLLKKFNSEFNFNKSYLKHWRSMLSCFALMCYFLIICEK